MKNKIAKLPFTKVQKSHNSRYNTHRQSTEHGNYCIAQFVQDLSHDCHDSLLTIETKTVYSRFLFYSWVNLVLGVCIVSSIVGFLSVCAVF